MRFSELKVRPLQYTLKDKKAVPIDDILEWGQTFEFGNQVVARTRIKHFLVCTDFLGIDHNYAPEGEPLLFETMVKDLKSDNWIEEIQPRFVTWEQAEKGHKKVVGLLKYRLRLGQGLT